MAPIGRTAAARGTRAALAAAVLLPLTVAGSATAASAATAPHTAPQAAPHAAPLSAPAQKKLPEGLYGTADPEFDGVWRQSLAVLAQRTQDLRPAPAAVGFLTGQQCADGGFAAYRADVAEPCDAAAEDTNATAAAVQALSAAGGERKAVDKGVAWLKKIQNEDGGWGFNPGGPTDANSTAVVVGALAAVGEEPAKTAADGGSSPYDALAALQLGCDAKKAERGAYAYQPEDDGALFPNDYATAAAVLAGTGNGLGAGLAEKGAGGGKDEPVEAGACTDDPSPAQAADAGAAYLAQKLAAGDGHLPMMTGEGPDHNATAVAVLALAAGGHGSAAREPYGWLERDRSTLAWSKENPAALATLILAAAAVDADPGAFAGDTDLVARLNATGPQPKAAEPAADTAAEEESSDDGGPGVAVWSLLAVGLAAGAGIGLLASARRKRRG